MESKKELKPIRIETEEFVIVEMASYDANNIMSALRHIGVECLNPSEKRVLRELSVSLADALGR